MKKYLGYILAALILPTVAVGGYSGWPKSWDFASLKIGGAAVESAAASHTYADTGDTSTLTSAQGYADTGDASTLTSAQGYADTGDASTLTSAQGYADTGDALRVSKSGDGMSGPLSISWPYHQYKLVDSDGADKTWSLSTYLNTDFAVMEDAAIARFVVKAGGGAEVGGATVWTAGNDGSGSGLDADNIDGGAVLKGSKVYDFPNLNTHDYAATTLTVTGAAVGAPCIVSAEFTGSYVALNCHVTATNTVEIQAVYIGSNPIGNDLVSQTYNVVVFNP